MIRDNQRKGEEVVKVAQTMCKGNFRGLRTEMLGTTLRIDLIPAAGWGAWGVQERGVLWSRVNCRVAACLARTLVHQAVGHWMPVSSCRFS